MHRCFYLHFPSCSFPVACCYVSLGCIIG